MISRRDLLKLGGLAGLGLTGTAGLSGCGNEPDQTGSLRRSGADLPQPFTLPIRKPEVLQPTGRLSDGTDHYRVAARTAEVEILPGRRTAILGYQGTFPGPTIETRRDRAVAVEHVNELSVPIVVHLHGGQVPAISDGFPTDLVLPRHGTGGRTGQRSTAGSTDGSTDGSMHDSMGDSMDGSMMDGVMPDPQANIVSGSRVYRYPGRQRAATLWYHDHRMDFTGPAVYRGLAGFHLIRDAEEDALDLPQGERELPLMLTDRAFDADGQLDYPALDPAMTGEPGVDDDFMEGVLGDVILVNGTPWPVAEVDAARYRLRWLNASNARRYQLVLDPPPPGGRGFQQIGSDGGLLAGPVGLDQLSMAPAERLDVVVDFARYRVGTKVTVRNRRGRDSTADVMQFVVARAAADPSRVVTALPAIERLQRSAVTTTRRFRFRRGTVGRHPGWLINNRPFDPGRPVATIRAGATELWRIGTDVHHPVHVHLSAFQVASRNGHSPDAADAGWKDTVDLRPAEYADLLVRFPNLPGRYVLHCHNLEHEDMAMMATFVIS
jgi:spore coat protein A